MSSCLQTVRNVRLEYASKYLRGHSFLFDNFFIRRLPNPLNVRLFSCGLNCFDCFVLFFVSLFVLEVVM